MSYVHKKIRVFREAGDLEIRRRRSDGRMKTYTSATDARAWCDSTEERRQHILELVRQGDGKGLSLGKYIPIEVIIDILLSNKNADIRRLLEEIEELKRIIKENGIEYEEKPVRVIEPVRSTDGQKQSSYAQESQKTPVKDQASKRDAKGARSESGAPGTSTGRDRAGTGKDKDASRQSADASRKPGDTSASTTGADASRGGKTGADASKAGTAGADSSKPGTIGADSSQAGTDGTKAGKAGADSSKAGTTGADSSKAGTAGADTGKAGADAADSGKAGAVGADSGKAGISSSDTGKVGAGAGKAGADAGKAGADEGKAGADAEKVAADARKAGADLGRAGGAAGKAGADAGKAGADAGKAGADAGKAGADAGKGGAGGRTGKQDDTQGQKINISMIDSDSEPSSEPSKEVKVIAKPKEDFKESTETGDTTSTPFISDSSDYESVVPDKTSSSRQDDKKAADLAGATRDDGGYDIGEKGEGRRSDHEIAVEAIEKLETIKNIVDGNDSPGLLEASEKAKKIAVTTAAKPTGKAYDSTVDSCKAEIESLEREIQSMKSKSSPEAEIIQREVQVLKKYCAQLAAIQRENTDLKNSITDDALRDKLAKLDEVTKERDRLRAKVDQLENQLAGGGVAPIGRDSDESEATRESFPEGSLRERLDRMSGLEDEVRSLRDKALMTEQAGDSADRDDLLKKIAELEKEAASCKCKMKELELLKCENNCLKMRAEDLARIQRDYDDLLKKTQGFDCLKAECAMYKTKYEALQSMEDELNELRARAQRCNDLERERELLMKEIQDCECCMNSQEDEMKRLVCHIDCLTQDLDKRQDEMKMKVLTMRASIEKKDCLIARSEQQLADVQDLLRNSIEHLSCETTCLRAKIEELEEEANKYRDALTTTEEKYKALEINYKCLKETNENNEINLTKLTKENNSLAESNKALLESLETEKRSSTKLDEALRKAIKSDEHLKQMLKQAKCAIKCITQKLEKHDLVGTGRLEAERENYLKKIKELEEGITEQQPCGSERIAQLEEELKQANSTIKCLKFNLDQMKAAGDENESLRQLVSQLQETAKNKVVKLEDTNENLSRKSQEIEEKCDDLKALLEQKDTNIVDLQNEIDKLKQQLEETQKSNENVEANLKKLSTESKSSLDEIEKLKGQINVLNAEIDRLNFMLENQKKECDQTIEKLKAKVSQSAQETTNDLEISRCQKENEVLKEEYEKLKAALEKERTQPVKDDSNKLKEESEKINNENNNLKTEIDKSNKENEELKKTNQELQKTNQDLQTENKKLKDEMNKLKSEIDKLKKEISNLTPNESAAKERDELLKQIEAQKKEIADLLTKINQPIKSGDSTIIQNKDKEIANLKATIENLEKKIQDLENQNKELAVRGAESEKKSDLEQKLETQNKENEKIKKDFDNLKATNQNLEKKLQEMASKDKKISDLQDQLKKCQQNNEALKKQLSEARSATAGAATVDDDRFKALEAELAKQKEECKNMLSSLQEQYDRDIKSLRKENEKSIDKLQAVHQESLSKISKEHEEITEKMKEEIKEKEASIQEKEASLQEKEASLQQKESSIQQKESLLKQKEESISHISDKKSLKEEKQKKLRIDGICICDILPSVIPISPTAGVRKLVKLAETVPPCQQQQQQQQQLQQQQQRLQQQQQQLQQQLQQQPVYVPYQPMPHPPQFQQPLIPRMVPIPVQQPMPAYASAKCEQKGGVTIKKIVELENKLMVKQGHTMQKITNLQSTVEKLKKELDVEKHRNNDLINRYTNQSKTVANMKVEMDLVKRENFQDKRKLENLNLTLKNYLGSSGTSNTRCLCHPRSESAFKVTTIPHFHTELTVVRDDNKFKHNCVMKRKACSHDRSSDSFEIDE